ncbi:MAG: two-component system response regulator CreB [Proteobacteria bacterium]|nr:two-component system response regulator CreB [Pseudomonadota bacterium]
MERLLGRVLIVEDEQSIAETISYALALEGFTPVVCATGREALDELRQRPVQLLVLDVGLPDISGFELCKRIRAFSPLPIIFLTARAEEIDRVLGLELGGDDYVAKPFSPRELVARAKAVLRRSAGQPGGGAPSRGHPSFAVDAERRRISLRGTALDLSPVEYRLLSVLVRHPGRVFSRQELMRCVTDQPEMTLERTIDTHIKNLRAKLRALAPDEELLRTHRGFGYALEED